MTLDYAHFHPVTSTLSSHVIAYITFLLRLWHEKQRPTRLLLIFRSLAQVTLMHASSALQLTLGHAQPEGVLLPTFIFEKEVCPWSSITFHALYDPNRASLPFHSHFAFSHMRRAPGGETQALSRYGLIPNGFPFPIADSSLLRHWLSHHLRSLGRP